MPAPVTIDDIRANTRIGCAPLVPEVRLHLLDEAGPWSASGVSLFADDGPQPYWAFAWGSGQAIARYLLDRPEVVAGRRVYDFGSGSGIGAIAAAMCGADSVVACDIDPAAALAAELNAGLNGAALETVCGDTDPATLTDIDVLLAADAFFHWPGNEALLLGDHPIWRVLLATPPRRDFAQGRSIPARRLRELAQYETKAYPELEPGFVRTAVVHELIRADSDGPTR